MGVMGRLGARTALVSLQMWLEEGMQMRWDVQGQSLWYGGVAATRLR